MKNIIPIGLALAAIVGIVSWLNPPKILPYYKQLTKTRISLTQDVQPDSQKSALRRFVGVQKMPRRAIRRPETLDAQ